MWKTSETCCGSANGRGNFDLKIERYEEVPPTEAIKIVEKANEQKELKNEA